jgi:anti-sigma regulatory factor (Ser/Thr protein kinase)
MPSVARKGASLNSIIQNEYDTTGAQGVSLTMKKTTRTTFSKDIPSKKIEIHRILYEAMDFFHGLKQQGLAIQVDEFYFRLVLDELLENALTHGNNLDESKRIGVSISVSEKTVDISVRDDGIGFRPDSVENPTGMPNVFRSHGRGLHLIRNIGELSWNKEGNTINVRVK